LLNNGLVEFFGEVEFYVVMLGMFMKGISKMDCLMEWEGLKKKMEKFILVCLKMGNIMEK
jgi:hypothetical protein